jgi:hypothetical protein
MGKLIVTEFITLDGIIDDPVGRGAVPVRAAIPVRGVMREQAASPFGRKGPTPSSTGTLWH